MNSLRVNLVFGDITKMEVDAIVNAANTWLMGGGGVDGAIHRAGGPDILEECRQIVARHGPCPTGQAVITTAGKLPARYVIHTVGPVWNGGKHNEEQLLKNAYENSLKLAVENGVETLAFPNISTGVYAFPKDKAAKIAIEAASNFLASDQQIQKVTFVCFDFENYHLYKDLLFLA